MSKSDEAQHQNFPITPWSLVGRAANATVESRRDSLGRLVQRYWPALRTHLVLKKRMKPEAAEDLLQSFVVDKVVAAELIAKADKDRGKFRTFLCTALDHYAISESRMRRAKKRSPTGDALADIDAVAEPAEDAAGPAAPGQSGDTFDVAWARQLIESAVRTMRDECM